jgi:hypothetical protein
MTGFLFHGGKCKMSSVVLDKHTISFEFINYFIYVLLRDSPAAGTHSVKTCINFLLCGRPKLVNELKDGKLNSLVYCHVWHWFVFF